MPTTPNEEMNAALARMELKHRVYNFMVSLGASLEAANLIASSPDELKKFSYDGVNLKLRTSELPAVDDDKARDLYLRGPFAALFTPKKSDVKDSPADMDPAVLAAARSGNWTAKGQLLRALGGDETALDKVLAGEAIGDNKAAPAPKKTHDNNPWENTPQNCDERGRYTANALTRQAALCRASVTAAADIAAAVGAKIGDVTAQRRAS